MNKVMKPVAAKTTLRISLIEVIVFIVYVFKSYVDNDSSQEIRKRITWRGLKVDGEIGFSKLEPNSCVH